VPFTRPADCRSPATTSAVNHLTANLTALAETVGQVNVGVRGRLGLDGGGPALGLPEPALAEGGDQPARRNGMARATA
jgi:hypothetical protein